MMMLKESQLLATWIQQQSDGSVSREYTTTNELHASQQPLTAPTPPEP